MTWEVLTDINCDIPRTHANAHTHTQTHTQTYSIHTHIRTYICMHACNIHTFTHTHAHTHTQTSTHTHLQTVHKPNRHHSGLQTWNSKQGVDETEHLPPGSLVMGPLSCLRLQEANSSKLMSRSACSCSSCSRTGLISFTAQLGEGRVCSM
jgi:hypothetical protein